MVIVRAVLCGLLVVLCAGFIPVGGCAKGCGAAGRAGASHADDFARVGTRSMSNYGDDLARGASRYGDDLARVRPNRVGAVGGVGHTGGGYADDLTHLSSSNLDSATLALPEAEGAVAGFAKKPTSSGVTLDVDDAGRTFGKDYGKSIDDIGITKKQHDEVMEAFETAQDIVEPIIEELAGGDDEQEVDPDKIVATAKARETLQLAALELEAQLASVLTPDQIRKFRAQFGSSELVAYRLGKDKPVIRAKGKTKTSDKPATGDKVQP